MDGDKTVDELFVEKLKVALSLITPGRTADEALKYSQAVIYLVQAMSHEVIAGKGSPGKK